MTGFTWTVEIDGTDIAGMVMETGTITYGRTDVFDQPTLPICSLDLITQDTDPRVAALYPEFSLGQILGTSGFTDGYSDTYAGPSSRLGVMVPVTVAVGTDSGFTDTYVDEYAGYNAVRFTGLVQAIDYAPDLIRLTVLPPVEAWGRLEVGGTDDSTQIPVEADTARIQRLCDEAGVDITIHGSAGPDVRAIPVNTNPSALLAQVQDVAATARGLFYVDRTGAAHYRTAANLAVTYLSTDAVTLPPGATPLGGFTMSLDASMVRTHVIIEYGEPDGVTNLRPFVTATDTDLEAAGYGRREYRGTVDLDVEADAQDYADAVLAQFAPTWEVPAVQVDMVDSTDAEIGAMVGLDLGAWASMPAFLPGSPVVEYAAPVLGYTESLSTNAWAITWHLSPSTIHVYPLGASA